MAKASWSGKFQIDGGPSLLMGNQVPLGGSASLPVALPAYQPAQAAVQADPAKKIVATPAKDAVTSSKDVLVLAASDTAQILAVQAKPYTDANGGKLTLTFQDSAKSTTASLDLTGDLLIANASLLSAICQHWVSIKLDSTIQQPADVQILVVWTL